MAKFLFIEYQNGGCDYTIGCGVRVNSIIEKPTPQEAVEEFISRHEDDYREDGILDDNPWDGEFTPDSVEMYEIIAEHPIDLDAIRERAQNEVDQRDELEREAKDREEYERLKKKYEK
jgi:hypothetical protein